MESITKLWLIFKARYGLERIAVVLAVVAVVGLSLWIAHSDSPPPPGENKELGLVIPAGQLIVPISLVNEKHLGVLMNSRGVIDVFMSGRKEPLVENLRVIKLAAGEGPIFGALVPENAAGKVQDFFSKPRLSGALKSENAGALKLHFQSPAKSSLLEIQTGD